MASNLTGRLKAQLARLHNDQQGAALIEYILIIAAIALPLLGLIVWFKDDILEWVGDAYEDATGRDLDAQ